MTSAAPFLPPFALLWRWSAGADALLEWRSLPEEQRRRFLEGARRFRCRELFYYYLAGDLPASAAEEFAAAYRSVAQLSFRQEQALNELSALFARERVRSVPFKGAWLARAVYPAPALRRRGDIDLLIPSEECRRARRLLLSAGWRSHRRGSAHHLPLLCRGGVALELHFALPRTGAAAMRELWRFLEEERVRGEDGKYEIPPELHFLILLQHACGHRWTNGAKFLIDLGFLTARFRLDRERIEWFRSRFQFCRPELLFAAFPELFGPEFSSEAAVPGSAVRLLRRMLTEPLPGCSLRRMELEMQAPDRFSPRWWLARLRGLAPASSMERHRVGWRGVLPWYFRDCAEKLRAFRRGVSEPADPALRRYWNDIQELERQLRPEESAR